MSDTNRSPRSVSRLAALAAAGLLAFTAFAASAQTQPEALIPNRITQAINPDQRVTLTHNVHPLAQAKYDQGAAPGSMATGRIMLVLKRSAAQEQALTQYLGDLQNPNSANYRKWLTPALFGQLYGISDTDLTTVTAWLQSQGFTIDKVPQARNGIIFSGNVAQIQQAFNTSIHRYVINGETHFANSTDPQVPAALAPVIAGIAQLNDFRPRSDMRKGKMLNAHYDSQTKTIKPDLTDTQNGVLYVGPADAATIYDSPNKNLNTKYTGTTYDGTGVTIGIAGDSNITVSNVNNYRSFFGLSANPPNIIVDGNDPGVNSDAVEALLDNEVSGGLAPGAKINFYTAADTDMQNGLMLAIYRAIDDNQVSILNVSFGLCEAAEGVGGNAQLLSAWEQAAAQGISVTVATGDSGSAGCDDPNAEDQAQNGLAVSAFASTPYNIAVGGTDFPILYSVTGNFAKYVNATSLGSAPYYGTALGYIPENPWNSSTATNFAASGVDPTLSGNTPYMDPNNNNATNIAAAGGGLSSVGFCNGSVQQDANGNYFCTGAVGPYPQPPFQSGVTNSISTTARSLPDVSLLASPGDWGATWAVCADAQSTGSGQTSPDCVPDSTGNFTLEGVGGTSAAAPAFAGMLAVISSSMGGERLGQANNVLYNLYTTQNKSGFHDITAGNISVYCTGGTQANCGSNNFLTGYNAGTGYDAATGLGSVDLAQLMSNWNKAQFTKTTTSLQINSGTSTINVAHGTSLNFNVAVSPGAATGDVSVVNDSGLANNGSIGFLTLSSGTASGTSADLPGGSYNVYAYYGGDVKNAASTSNKIAVNISAESSATAIGVSFYDPIQLQYYPSTTTSVPYGAGTAISGQPLSSNQNSTSNTPATGNITFTDTASLNSSSNVMSVTAAIASNGIASYNNWYTQAQSPAVASHSVTAAFPGDASYSSSTSSPLTFTITKGGTSVGVSGTQSGTNVTLTALINTDSIGLAPTGSVTFAVGSTTIGTASAPSSSQFVTNGNGYTVQSRYSVTIPSNTTGLVNGNNTVVATYAGDANYATSNASATVVIGGGGGGGSFSLSGSAITISAGATSGNTTTINVAPSSSGFTGTVNLTCSLTSSPTGAMAPPACSMNPTSVSLSGTKAATSTFTVTSTANSSALTYPLKNVFEAAGGTALACILMFTIPARRKGWRAILSLIAFAIAISGAIGCGGGSSSNNGGGGTTAGTYVFTVTGASGSTTSTTTVTVNVN